MCYVPMILFFVCEAQKLTCYIRSLIHQGPYKSFISIFIMYIVGVMNYLQEMSNYEDTSFYHGEKS